MTEWHDVALGELGLFASGKPIKPGLDGPYPAFGSNGTIGRSVQGRHPRGLIVGRVGAYCGSVAISHEPFWASDNTIVVEPAMDSDLNFLYFLLRNADLNRHAGGSAQPLVTQATLKSLVFRVPDPTLRAHIGRVLRTFDDLIENNRHRVELLEEMTRAIYREWFVRFRYPGHDDVPLIDSEVGLFPDGWDSIPLVEAAHLTMGQSPKSEFYNFDGEGTPFHQGVTDFGSHYPTHRKYCTVEGRRAHDGDVLVSVRAPVGRLNLADTTIVIGRGVASIRARDGRQALLHANLKEVFAEEDSMGGGTIFKAIGKNELEQVRVLRVPDDLAQRADQDLAIKSDLIRALTFSNRQLASLRDILLPKLVTGEIDVSSLDLDSLVEESVA